MLQRLSASVDQRILPCKLFCFWLSASAACYYAFLPVGVS